MRELYTVRRIFFIMTEVKLEKFDIDAEGGDESDEIKSGQDVLREGYSKICSAIQIGSIDDLKAALEETLMQ